MLKLLCENIHIRWREWRARRKLAFQPIDVELRERWGIQ